MSVSINAARSGLLSRKRPLVIGHRGTAGTVPENTLESFKQAVLDGADMLECDVRLSADNEVIIIHDQTLDRTTNGSGLVASMTLSQIKKLDAGYRFTTDGGKTFPFRGKGIRVSTLAELLRELPAVPLNLELKVESVVLVGRCVDLLRTYGRLKDVTLVFANASTRLARLTRRLAPDAITGHSKRECMRFVVLARLRQHRLFKPRGPYLHVPVRRRRINVLTAKLVAAAHKLGMEVHAWTVNDEPEMRRCLALGVDALFTDFPARLRQVVDAQDSRRPAS